VKGEDNREQPSIRRYGMKTKLRESYIPNKPKPKPYPLERPPKKKRRITRRG